MSEKDDKTILIETHTDVRWIKSKMIEIHDRTSKVEKDVEDVKKKVWHATGFIAAGVIVIEFFKEKIAKLFP